MGQCNSTHERSFNVENNVEILEWSIPQAWRTKFDLAGYIPTSHNKNRFTTECEQIERNEAMMQKSLINNHPKGSTKNAVHKKGRKDKHKTGKPNSYSKGRKEFYCKEHGKNPTHDTEACFTLKNRANKEKNPSPHLTKKSFRREINTLARHRPKKKVIEMFATVLHAEHMKLNHQKKSKIGSTKKMVESGSDESEDEVHVMETDDAQIDEGPEADEEQTYLEKIKNLGSIIQQK